MDQLSFAHQIENTEWWHIYFCGYTDTVAYFKKIKAIWRRRHGNPMPFFQITAYSDDLSAYILKKYVQIIRIVDCFSAHDML